MATSKITKDSIVLVVTPSQQEQVIPYPSGFTMGNSMIVAAQYKSGSRGFNAYDGDSDSYPMPYYHTSGITINASHVDSVFTKLAIVLRKIGT